MKAKRRSGFLVPVWCVGAVGLVAVLSASSATGQSAGARLPAAAASRPDAPAAGQPADPDAGPSMGTIDSAIEEALSEADGATGECGPSDVSDPATQPLTEAELALQGDFEAPTLAADWFGEFSGAPDGPRTDDVVLIMPGFILWEVDRDKNGSPDFNTQWGLPGDRYVAGEPLSLYRDGYDEAIVVRREANNRALWYVKWNQYKPGFSGRYSTRYFGGYGHPMVADFNGDGRDEAAMYYVYYTSTFPRRDYWCLLVDRNGDLNFSSSSDTKAYPDYGLGSADRMLAGSLGAPCDEVAVWRNATGNWELYTTVGGTPTDNRFATAQFGLPGDLPFLADLNDDGHDDLCVWRPSNNLVYVNYYEYEDRYVNAGYRNGDVDRTINYSGYVSAANAQVGSPGLQWREGALGMQLD